KKVPEVTTKVFDPDAPPGAAAVRSVEQKQAEIASNKILRKELAKARARLRRAQAALRKLNIVDDELAEPRRRVREIIQNPENEKLSKSKQGRKQILRELIQAVDFNAAELMEDATFTGKFIEAFGLGKAMRAIALSGTGQRQTMRSAMAILRELAAEFDNSKLKLEDLIPDSSRQHLTMETVKRQLDQKMGTINSAYGDVVKTGRFGSTLNPIQHWRKRREFDRELVQHIAGKTSTDADVVKLAKIWNDIAQELEEIGVEVGEFKGRVKNFFPRRVQIGRVMKHQDDFTDDLAAFFLKKWQNSDTVYLDALVAHGTLETYIDEAGKQVWKVIATGEEVPANLKVANIQDVLGIDEGVYRAMLTEADDTGRTPLYKAAQQATDHLMGRDSYERTAAGFVQRKHGGRIKHNLERRLDDDILFDTDMEKWMDYRFTDLAKQYLDSTGFTVMNQLRHQQRWGIKRLTMDETLTTVREVIDEMVNKLTKEEADGLGIDRQALKTQMKVGIESMREKLYLMEGRLPTLADHTNGLREWMTQAGQAAAGWVYAGSAKRSWAPKDWSPASTVSTVPLMSSSVVLL
ncbi:MAG: hypothetical protein ACXAB9_12695, partial [Candidatus Thorarchaeota archaeon]